jgi:segregation and condensation protein B
MVDDSTLWREPIDPKLRRDIEACLFASGSPLTIDGLAQALAGTGSAGPREIEAAIHDLAQEYPLGGGRGFELVPLAGGWAFRTNPHCHEVIEALFEIPDDATRLSPAAMEVLAVIAYSQPVSRPQIADVRGVNSDSPLQRLLDRELITEVGRSTAPGGAVLYGTTERFLAMFGLSGLDELPQLEGFALGEEQKDDLRRRLGLLSSPE